MELLTSLMPFCTSISVPFACKYRVFVCLYGATVYCIAIPPHFYKTKRLHTLSCNDMKCTRYSTQYYNIIKEAPIDQPRAVRYAVGLHFTAIYAQVELIWESCAGVWSVECEREIYC